MSTKPQDPSPSPIQTNPDETSSSGSSSILKWALGCGCLSIAFIVFIAAAGAGGLYIFKDKLPVQKILDPLNIDANKIGLNNPDDEYPDEKDTIDDRQKSDESNFPFENLIPGTPKAKKNKDKLAGFMNIPSKPRDYEERREAYHKDVADLYKKYRNNDSVFDKKAQQLILNQTFSTADLIYGINIILNVVKPDKLKKKYKDTFKEKPSEKEVMNFFRDAAERAEKLSSGTYGYDRLLLREVVLLTETADDCVDDSPLSKNNDECFLETVKENDESEDKIDPELGIPYLNYISPQQAEAWIKVPASLRMKMHKMSLGSSSFYGFLNDDLVPDPEK